MGEEADAIGWDYDPDDLTNQDPLEEPVWAQRDGTKTPITQMADSHILNTIRYLERSNRSDSEEWLDLLNDEIYRRENL